MPWHLFLRCEIEKQSMTTAVKIFIYSISNDVKIFALQLSWPRNLSIGLSSLKSSGESNTKVVTRCTLHFWSGRLVCVSGNEHRLHLLYSPMHPPNPNIFTHISWHSSYNRTCFIIPLSLTTRFFHWNLHPEQNFRLGWIIALPAWQEPEQKSKMEVMDVVHCNQQIIYQIVICCNFKFVDSWKKSE